MATLNRRQLKGIVKECLLEILTEGIAAPDIEESVSLSEARRRPRKAEAPRASEKREPSFDRAVKESAQMLTSDPVLQDIFSDTARTTLQEHLNAESMNPSSALVSNTSNSIPVEAFGGSESFGDSSSKWAALAFSEPASPSGRYT